MKFFTRNWFPVLLSLIAAVSMYDTALIVLFSDTIGAMEENPVGNGCFASVKETSGCLSGQKWLALLPFWLF